MDDDDDMTFTLAEAEGVDMAFTQEEADALAEDDIAVDSSTGVGLFRSTSGTRGFQDPSDFQANELQQFIEFYHLPSSRSVRFKAFVTGFKDKFTSEWNKENLFGRMDPIQTFKGTQRTIDLQWEVPAASLREARANLKRASLLFNMLYPAYDSGGIMTTPPLFKLKMMNLIQDSSTTATSGGSAKHVGLLGTVGGFEYDPDFEAGVFHAGPGKIYPQVIRLSCTFTVNHTHIIGWDKMGDYYDNNNNFPYGDGARSPTISGAISEVLRGTGSPDAGDEAADQGLETGTNDAVTSNTATADELAASESELLGD